MALEPGIRLGPYEVTAAIGAGGMGEVYQALDTRLDRIVAIKVLPAELAGDLERRKRFEREAKAIAALNHPHICTLHDVGHADGIDFLVMEHLQGESLQDRLKKGALPLDQALQVAMAIADALGKAHRHGITHRDLKPGNIFLTKSGAKLLDFGLAKPREVGAALDASTTLGDPLTARGTLLGTLPYMAPEQLEGREVDARTDIWAFGCVLFEMLAGRRSFSGDTQASLIGSILKDHVPAVSSLPAMASPSLDRIIQTCLAKDPDDRFQSAYDLLLQLRWSSETNAAAGGTAPVVVQSKHQARLAWGLAAIAGIVAVVTTGLLMLRRPADPPVIGFAVAPPADHHWSGGPPAISPDGTKVVFAATQPGQRAQLWLRPLDAIEARPLPGTDDARMPFWAPDSRHVGFFADSKLKQIDIESTTGQVEIVADLGSGGRGGTWNKDGVILFRGLALGAGLLQVSAAGGVPVPVTNPEGADQDNWPQFLPDGRRFIFFKESSEPSAIGIFVASLDDSTPRFVLETTSNGRYAEPGYLLFLRNGTLFRQAFDADSAAITGEIFRVAEHVGYCPRTSVSLFDASPAGVLAWGGGNCLAYQTVPTWFDRAGNDLGPALPQGDYQAPAISPDGNLLAVHRTDYEADTTDIWVFDLINRQPQTQLTTSAEGDLDPVWSPDGAQVVFESDRDGTGRDLYSIRSAARDTETLLFQRPGHQSASDWSRDGQFILYNEGGDIFALPIEGEVRDPMPVIGSSADERQGRFSPDGKWVAFASDRGIRVGPFPGTGTSWPLAPEGSWPLWRDDGREIYFHGPDDSIMAIPIDIENGVLTPGVPALLFRPPMATAKRANRNDYTASSDGKRFLILAQAPASQDRAEPITVVVNWLARIGR